MKCLLHFTNTSAQKVTCFSSPVLLEKTSAMNLLALRECRCIRMSKIHGESPDLLLAEETPICSTVTVSSENDVSSRGTM